jgi:hypothetical protein
MKGKVPRREDVESKGVRSGNSSGQGKVFVAVCHSVQPCRLDQRRLLAISTNEIDANERLPTSIFGQYSK